MKKIILTFLCFVLLGGAMAQTLKVRSYVEKTRVSPKLGTAIGFQNQYGWEYGAFYQESSIMEGLLMGDASELLKPRMYEQEFMGLYFAAPVIVHYSYLVRLNVRTGVSNGENFVITPSILADYHVSNRLDVGLGVGTRALHPTFQASFSFSL